jgi:kinesin family protein 5
MPSPASSLLKQPTSVSEKGNVKVYCRFRPLNQRELSTTENTLCVTFKNELTCAVMGVNQKTGNSEPIDWTYDRTFDPNCTQSDVYETAVMPVIE